MAAIVSLFVALFLAATAQQSDEGSDGEHLGTGREEKNHGRRFGGRASWDMDRTAT